jgi:hypothetical protein
MAVPVVSPLALLETSTPATPANVVLLYAKSDGNVYALSPSGVEVPLVPISVPQVTTAPYTVATNTQVMYFSDITLGGDLTVNGLLQGVH